MKECPITLCPLIELSNPVAFAGALDQPYELDALCAWMEVNPVNPLTGREARMGDLVALGSVGQQQSSAGVIERRSLTINTNQVILKMTEMQPLIQNSVLSEYKIFRSEVKDIKAELGQLNDKIRDVNKTMAVLMGEKSRIETRVEFMNKQYLNNDATCQCVIA